jgi:hypothetical protein
MSDQTKLIFAAVALYLLWQQSKRNAGAFTGGRYPVQPDTETVYQKPMRELNT